ncbi:signal peptidase I [Brevundimonas vitis]|uniref:Signal peptidase I n=2 Tax=Brevundimonas vitisensis TaxID=2800818 RepID=A0ABX7BNC0_9CAUL|nr:signal peptidase I [Brevundimonas vitisensis]
MSEEQKQPADHAVDTPSTSAEPPLETHADVPHEDAGLTSEPASSLPVEHHPVRELEAEAPREVAPSHEEPPAAEPVASLPEPDPTPVAPPMGTVDVYQPEAAASAAAVAAAGTTAASNGKRPVWSDQGDAPFEDADTAPVYARKGKKGSKGGSDGNEFVEIVKTVVFALLIALVLRVVLFQPFTIPSASMEPNLYEGDYIVVSKWSYGYSKHAIPFSPPLFEGRIFDNAPERGDIAVFKLPRDNKTDYIKRVIGVPGDQIQMINNVLHINGTPVQDVVVGQAELADVFGPRNVTQLTETLPNGKTFAIQDFGPGFPLDDTPVFEVPAGHYFMMGDNRDNSIDSREQSASGVGLVPAENLVGKAEIILFSWSPGASLWNPISWFSKVRPSRFFNVLD